jgi:hypothetical protein
LSSDGLGAWTCNLVIIGTLTWTGLQNMVIILKEAKCMAKYASVAVFLGMLAAERTYYDIYVASRI